MYHQVHTGGGGRVLFLTFLVSFVSTLNKTQKKEKKMIIIIIIILIYYYYQDDILLHNIINY